MRTLIIDDEFIQQDYLRTQLDRHCPTIEVVKSIQNPIDALKFLRKNEVDLIFLDVMMPEMTGFEFIEIMGAKNLPPIIFTTAHSEYAINAFKVNAIDYLLKPIDKEELIAAVEKANTHVRLNQENNLENIISSPQELSADRLVLTDGQSHTFVYITEIIRIEGSGSYSDFFMKNGEKLTTSRRLNYYWVKLQNLHFIRTHQSHVVNVNHIIKYSKIDGEELILTNNERAPISTRQKQEVKTRLGIT